MRLIDADALIKEAMKSPNFFIIKYKVQNAPTVDAVPVVRCKDCKHWDKHSQYGYDNENGVYGNYCKLWTPEDDFYAVETPADGFCYNGERKDDD